MVFNFYKINKVLALVGIRKLMDFFVFTQKELSYLDDIMPEIVKRSEEDGHDLENTTQKTENESVVIHFLKFN